ncbi:anthranilate synthase component I [candidate division WOR-1 bacterium RIFOXYB2_FULL_48_7]|uniref:Anthranilate synthase component 1 n=1 Tax=candidate division WOR-1 bacterium RIFOXYB2_FULL_48_7 TaxID=1802583 RepID=A0A1F4TIG8_UNCSA|nr:MAG: anthranilate synthase component I [candidate division WOR-1 bacterium RIFOXYB2_FULL_48_7]
MYFPDKKTFIKLAKKGNLVPVFKEIVADLETPVSAFRKIAGDYSFLLESVEGGENIARYSFMGTCLKSEVRYPKTFEEIRQLLKQYKPVKVKGLPRFHGGLIGHINYDAVRMIEKLPEKNRDDLNLPLMEFFLTDTILAFDHVKHKIIIISNAQVAGDPAKAYRQACRKIDKLAAQLAKPLKISAADLRDFASQKKQLKYSSNLTRAEFEKMVVKAKEFIKAGEIIQVVLSQRLQAETKADPFTIYRVLRMINPSPYMYYLSFGQNKIIGSSPEVMVRLENNQATIRPIAGTRPRGANEPEDNKLAADLLASVKERAEHIMLVDLARNDLGRVCDYGSVRLTEQMAVERYSHVMHIVSNVCGQIKKGQDAIDLLRATFPAGTVSGAPKVRAMEIIEELETLKRGLYAGCVGYFSFSGDLDTAITIRTILVKGRQAYVQAGAGIVADSQPSKEFQETLNKATALLSAINATS